MFEKSESENKRLFYMYSLTGAGLKFWRRGMINLTTPDRVTGKTKIKYKYQMKQLRKTFPSWLANAGVERGILKDLLDHSNISITENHYLKIEAQRYLRDVNKVRFKTKIP
jgi:integrase